MFSPGRQPAATYGDEERLAESWCWMGRIRYFPGTRVLPPRAYSAGETSEVLRLVKVLLPSN